jgi:hypothetical protein
VPCGRWALGPVSGNAEVERVMGIEPTSSAWEAEVLPLNYTREPLDLTGPPARCANDGMTHDWAGQRSVGTKADETSGQDYDPDDFRSLPKSPSHLER